MSSNTSSPARAARAPADVAARLARAIDACATAARHQDGLTDQDVARRLAAVWAMLADADPQLAARAAQYAES